MGNAMLPLDLAHLRPLHFGSNYGQTSNALNYKLWSLVVGLPSSMPRLMRFIHSITLYFTLKGGLLIGIDEDIKFMAG